MITTNQTAAGLSWSAAGQLLVCPTPPVVCQRAAVLFLTRRSTVPCFLEFLHECKALRTRFYTVYSNYSSVAFLPSSFAFSSSSLFVSSKLRELFPLSLRQSGSPPDSASACPPVDCRPAFAPRKLASPRPCCQDHVTRQLATVPGSTAPAPGYAPD